MVSPENVGVIESVAFDERSGKLRVSGHDKPIWVDPILKSKVNAFKVGDKVSVDTRPGKFYDFLMAIHGADKVAPEETMLPPSSSSKAPEMGPPPKPYVPTKEKNLAATPGKGRACSARFMAKFRELVKKGKSLEIRVYSSASIRGGEKLYIDLDKIIQVLAKKMKKTSIARPVR